MTEYRLEFELVGLPKTTNSIGRAHWTVKVKEAKRWKQDVYLSAYPKRPQKTLTQAKLHLTRFSSTCPDSDGLVSSFKHVIDGLIDAQIIADDSYRHIGMPSYSWIETKRGKGKIKVVVIGVSHEEDREENRGARVK